MINFNERAGAQFLASPLSPQGGGVSGDSPAVPYAPPFGADGIARMFRPFAPQQNGQPMLNYLPLNGMGGIMQMFMNAIAQLLSSFGMFSQQPQGPGTQQNCYSNASATSLGDPHLAFNGTDAAGNAHDAKFDSMAPHADFLESNSFVGGLRVSTDVTAPGLNGVTWNRSAAVTTNYGGTSVTLDKDGHASISQNGRGFLLANGQSVDLGNGETVVRAADGSVRVSDNDGRGGFVTTTLRTAGSGVDVSVDAQNVDLGGDVVR